MISMNKLKLVSAIYEALEEYELDSLHTSVSDLTDCLIIDYTEEVTGKGAK